MSDHATNYCVPSPKLSRTPWTLEEDLALLHGKNVLGLHWAKIVENYPIFILNGRGDRCARDRWRRLMALQSTTEETIRNLIRIRNVRNHR
jgi:hypothetical protein